MLVPVLVVALLGNTPAGDVLAAMVFALASLTDFVDGYLARARARRGAGRWRAAGVHALARCPSRGVLGGGCVQGRRRMPASCHCSSVVCDGEGSPVSISARSSASSPWRSATTLCW